MLKPVMAGDDMAVRIGKDRVGEPECFDRRLELVGLTLRSFLHGYLAGNATVGYGQGLFHHHV